MTMFLKLVFTTQILYIIALNTIKISFCVFYLYIFFFTTKPRRVCYFLIAILIAEAVEEVFVVIFQCSPVQKVWNPSSTAHGHCMNLTVFFYISFGIKFATDIVLFTLPIPQLLKLHVSGLRKAGLLTMFGLGLLVCVTSIIRVIYISDFSKDHTWKLVPPLNWSAVEVCLAIFISCLPSFKAFITTQTPSIRRHVTRLTGNNPSDATRGDGSLTPQSSPGTASSGRAREVQSMQFAGIVFSETTTGFGDDTPSSANDGLRREASLLQSNQHDSIRDSS
ncbi:hypothetical protein BBP40_000934 [Aspergillus hancockii]|nr:hypothetical protein BBP40_000934 [Aspergillus hancockii]